MSAFRSIQRSTNVAKSTFKNSIRTYASAEPVCIHFFEDPGNVLGILLLTYIQR